MVELFDPVGIGIHGQQTADRRGVSCALYSQVESMWRAIHFQDRAGPGRFCVDRVPIQIQVVANADLPTRGVGNDVHVRVVDCTEHSSGQFRSRLPPTYVQGRDDEIESCELRIVVIESAIGPNFELAAMQQPESLGRCLDRCGAGILFRRKPSVQGRDHASLQGHALGSQAAGDRQGHRMVRHDLIGVAASARRLSHDLDGLAAIGPIGMGVQVAAQVGKLKERWQFARDGGFDFTGIFAQLRLDEGQVEEPIGRFLRGERSQLGGGAAQDRAVLSQAREALFGQAPALVPCSFAEAHVVRFGACEVDQICPGGSRRHPHQIDLRTTGLPNRGLLGSLVDHRLDIRQRREPPNRRSRIHGLHQDVEVADRLSSAAIRAGCHHLRHSVAGFEGRRHESNDVLRLMQEQAMILRPKTRDPCKDRRLRTGGDPSKSAQAARFSRRPKGIQISDPKRRPELPHGLGPETGHRKDIEQGDGKLRQELLVVAEAARPRQLGNLVRDGSTHARKIRRMAVDVGPGHGNGRPADRIRSPVVGHGLEHELTLDLEQVADLMEDACEFGVGGQFSPGRQRRILGLGGGGHHPMVAPARCMDQAAMTRSRPSRLARSSA